MNFILYFLLNFVFVYLSGIYCEHSLSLKNTAKRHMPNATCAVIGCSNSQRRLKLWIRNPENKGKASPFELFKFPTNPSVKLSWEKRINRVLTTDRKVKYGTRVYSQPKGSTWKAFPNDYICSIHFPDKKPSDENPY